MKVRKTFIFLPCEMVNDILAHLLSEELIWEYGVVSKILLEITVKLMKEKQMVVRFEIGHHDIYHDDEDRSKIKQRIKKVKDLPVLANAISQIGLLAPDTADKQFWKDSTDIEKFLDLLKGLERFEMNRPNLFGEEWLKSLGSLCTELKVLKLKLRSSVSNSVGEALQSVTKGCKNLEEISLEGDEGLKLSFLEKIGQSCRNLKRLFLSIGSDSIYHSEIETLNRWLETIQSLFEFLQILDISIDTSKYHVIKNHDTQHKMFFIMLEGSAKSDINLEDLKKCCKHIQEVYLNGNRIYPIVEVDEKDDQSDERKDSKIQENKNKQDVMEVDLEEDLPEASKLLSADNAKKN